MNFHADDDLPVAGGAFDQFGLRGGRTHSIFPSRAAALCIPIGNWTRACATPPPHLRCAHVREPQGLAGVGPISPAYRRL